MMRIIPPFACLVLIMSLAATICGPARAADLDGVYVPPAGRAPADRRDRRPLPPPPPPPEIVYAPTHGSPTTFRVLPRLPFVEQPFLLDPYAPTVFGAPLSAPTYGYGY